jgi:hypothetical protein
VLDQSVQVADRALKRGAVVAVEREAATDRLDEDPDASQLLAYAVVEIESDPARSSSRTDT